MSALGIPTIVGGATAPLPPAQLTTAAQKTEPMPGHAVFILLGRSCLLRGLMISELHDIKILSIKYFVK